VAHQNKAVQLTYVMRLCYLQEKSD